MFNSPDSLTILSGDKLAVWQDDDGLIWDATLIKVGSSASQVTLMIKRIQLLHCDESQKSHIWELNSHIGSTEETKWVGDLHSLQIGKVAFEEKLKSYSGHSWKDRDADPIDSFWIYLEIKHRESLILTGEIGELPSSVKKVLEFIFKSRNLDAYTQAMKSTGRSILHDKTVEKRKLVIGIAVLSRLMTLGKTPEPTPGTMSQAKQTLLWIYQWFYLQTSTSSITEKDVRHELESLDLLLKLHDAKEILKNQSQRSLALSQVSQALGLAKMLPGGYSFLDISVLSSMFAEHQSMKLTFHHSRPSLHGIQDAP